VAPQFCEKQPQLQRSRLSHGIKAEEKAPLEYGFDYAKDSGGGSLYRKVK
jgi:hypothetical protein